MTSDLVLPEPRSRAHPETAPRKRTYRRFLLPVISALIVSACTSTEPPPDPGPGPEAAMTAFAEQFENARVDLASGLTDAPQDATALLGDVLVNLRPDELRVSPGEVRRTGPHTAESDVTMNWALPSGEWTYRTTWSWARGNEQDGEWTLVWSPTVIHPRLGARQTIAVRTTPAAPGLLTDRNGQQIVAPTRIFSVVLLPEDVTDLGQTAAQLATLLTPFDPAATAETIVAEVTAMQAEAAPVRTGEAPDSDGSNAPPTTGEEAVAPSYTVTNLREEEYLKIRRDLDRIDGLTFPSEVRTLPLTRSFAKTLLGEVTSVVSERLNGQQGWRVVSVDTTGADLETLTEQIAITGETVQLTIDTIVQRAAERALAPVQQAAVLIAIQPSTGEILTVAQNSAADQLGAIALTGQYPPGSTFKIVTATAALSRGLIAPTTNVECPGTLFVDGREINNYAFFDLGTVPARVAMARSCNTTFASLATAMPADALTTAAKTYGIGLDFVIEGMTTLTGQVPPAESSVQRAENGFGQGEILMTPFAAAMMAATAAAGEMPIPTLIRGSETSVDQRVQARSSEVQRDIDLMMRAVVTEGTAGTLVNYGDVHAKTGTAQYAAEDGADRAHAWTVGYRGDLAFAAFAVGGEDGSLTVQILERFLNDTPQ